MSTRDPKRAGDEARVEARREESAQKRERDLHEGGGAPSTDPTNVKADTTEVEPKGIPGGALRDPGPKS
jgi:hypothetical protein